ncbi:hypothetical protein [Streptomyces luteolus]|uniref:DUF2530 domain-containing protein n=1 Tax=Streptomyces luteolus TaxID=3043615 RepID=A0ABT6SYN8_9ACTN|nr:hypothetical protein [Streptomyces sp. B-S-A12]MDI3420716.1 hypothetical protein [Streptomyces sp. B-S-A12]
MDARPQPPGVAFEPTRPLTRGRKAGMFVFGALVWVAAGALAIALLGHSYILRHLLAAVVISWLGFGLALLWGIAIRRGEERRELP